MNLKKGGLRILLFIAILLFLLSSFAFAEGNLNEGEDNSVVRAKVLEVISEKESDLEEYNISMMVLEQEVKVRITSGEFKGNEIIIINEVDKQLPMWEDYVVEKNDKVIITYDIVNGKIANAYIYEFARDNYLLVIVLVFLVLMVIVGGLKGVKTIITLLITAVSVLGALPFVILKGVSPILASILVSIFVIFTTLFIVSGRNRKTVAAGLGTIGGVIVAGSIALVVGNLSRLTGLSSHESVLLMYIPQDITFDYRGLLFAAIILGALGAVMDVSMSIASSMDEILETNPFTTTENLIKSGFNVGRDIMGTMANTLILAYIGASLQFVILTRAYNTSLIEILNKDFIAAEVVRALAGSIGLIASIPTTIFVYIFFAERE